MVGWLALLKKKKKKHLFANFIFAEEQLGAFLGRVAENSGCMTPEAPVYFSQSDTDVQIPLWLFVMRPVLPQFSGLGVIVVI